MDFANLGKLCDWELDKAMFLIKTARKLGMSLSGYGELAVNQNSGNTYLWLEEYPFTLYMPISCELVEADVWVLGANDGEETEKTLDEFDNLKDIENWAYRLSVSLEDN